MRRAISPFGFWGRICLALLIALGAASALQGAAAQDSEPPFGKLPLGVTPTHYWIDLDVQPQRDRFSGEVRIAVTLDEARETIWLHGRGHTVTESYIETEAGARVEAAYSEVEDRGVARLQTADAVGPGKATLVLRYNAPFNQSLEGLYQVKQGGEAYAYTQFQPLSARRAFPGFDEPRFKTPFDVSITVAGNDLAVSNGPERETTELEDGRRRVVFETTEPLPTYLVAFAVGDFDVVEWEAIPPNDVRAQPIPLRGIAPKGKGGKLDYGLRHTAAMMKILEDYFAIPYPYAKLDLIAAAQFKSGGMENAGAIIYREDKILIGDSPSIYQLRGYAYIHAHELAHSWFGNYVTPAWWDDLWLNEAFATWMADRVVHAWQPEEYDDRGPTRSAIRAMWQDRLVTARKIRQPIVNDHDIATAFDRITYNKGGGVISMIERYLGPGKFRDGVRRFIAQHPHGVATSDDFFAALSESSDDLGVTHAFRSFVEQPGTPMVEVDWTCDADGVAEVTLQQSRSLPLGSNGTASQLWSLPLCLAYPNGGTRDSQCLMMKEARTTALLETKSCPAWLLPNAKGAAYLHFALPERGWDALLESMDQLEPSEALATVRSVRAAYEAGLTNAERILQAAEVTAPSPHWDVAGASMQDMRDLKNFLLPLDMRPAAYREMQRIFRPALARFDLSDEALAREAATPGQALLRADLIWFMAADAYEPELRATLSRLGQAYLGYGGDGDIHEEVLHPNLVRIALIVATEEVGPPFAEAVIARLRKSEDAVLRAHLIHALGNQTERPLVEMAWDLILDPEFPNRWASELLWRQGRRVDNQEPLFTWMTANYEELLARLPSSHRAWLPWRASAFCTERDRNRVADFYEERSKEHRGGPRALENVLEAIEICTAVVRAQRANAIETFNGR